MGERAQWSDVEEIKRRLLQPAAEQVGEKLGRASELVIEKDKLGSDPIHPSMFREAIDADVYIADLTGANANVYLELGVRWALKDGVTILIAQDVQVKFNASANRVIPYGPMPDELDQAVGQIAASAVKGMGHPGWVDSPVRSSLPLLTAPRSEWEALREEIRQLRELQADELVAAASRLPPAEAIATLRQAVERNPASGQAHFGLGVALRKVAEWDEAIRELQTVVTLDPDFAPGHRELGVACSKSEHLAEAAEAFRRAVELNPGDAETWATLGGLRRRLARCEADQSFDWSMLRDARDAYQRAGRLRGNDTYALVNVARVELLLSAAEPGIRPAVLAEFRKLENLARYETEEHPEDEWKRLDLADTLLLTGRTDEGLAEIYAGIALIDLPSRQSTLSSVISPLQDFLNADVLEPPTAAAVRTAIEIYEEAIEEAGRA
jgi:tetratricopeptide (TPR) repeat protein